MRFIQPRESSILLEALLKIMDTYYATPTKAATKKAYTSYLEKVLIEIADISQSALDDVYVTMEEEKTRKA